MSNFMEKSFIFVTCAILIGAIYFAFNLKNFKNLSVREVVVNGDETHEVLEVADLKLIPSESKEYRIEITSHSTNEYSVTLDFVETNDGGMKEFVDVRLELDGQVLYEGKLMDLFGDFTIDFNVFLKAKEASTVSIVYSMDSTVGNEAKKTFSDFNIDLKINKVTGVK